MDANELARIKRILEIGLGLDMDQCRALLTEVERLQRIEVAAREVVADVTAENWYEDAFTYIVDAEKLERLRNEVGAPKRADDGTQS